MLEKNRLKDFFRKRIICLGKERQEKIIRIEVETEEIDPLLWLKAQKFGKKIYWAERDFHFLYAGIGESIFNEGDSSVLFKKAERFLKKAVGKIRFFCGIRFPCKKKESIWNVFGNGFIILPSFELIKKNKKTFFACNIMTPIYDLEKVLQDLENIEFSESETKKSSVRYTERSDIPEKSQWEEIIKEVIWLIRKKEIEKIVLARKTEFRIKDRFDAFDFLRTIRDNSFKFLIQLDPSVCFFGISPERIFLKIGRYIETEAIAGTKRRGMTEKEDRELYDRLKEDKKELKEHRLVSDFLEKRMKKMCSSFKISKKENVIKLSFMQHLYTKFSGILSEDISDQDIIFHLYPNPAIAGYPVEDALRKIEKLERFDRGFYSAPFGWISQSCSEFITAIRSSLATPDSVYLFAGAGIVENSKPELEWDELEYKIKSFVCFMKNERELKHTLG